MDLSGKTYSKCREAIKRGQEKAATEGCGFLLPSDIVRSYLFLLVLLLFLSVILALCTHHINVHIMCFCVREGTKKLFYVDFFLCCLLGMFPKVIEKAAVDTMH